MTGSGFLRGRVAASLLCFTAIVGASTASAAAGVDTSTWNQPHKPFQIYGNTYYVGTAGLSAVLVTSAYGHVLVDGATPEAAPLIAKNIQELGFNLHDVKGIVFSHAHWDHVGGIAELQRLTGAQVYSLRPAQDVLRTGKLSKDDPQYAARSTAIPKVESIWVVTDEQLLGVGQLRMRVHATPGHTPGSATWTWDACEGSRCLAFVYADSFTAVSADKYRFKDHPEYVAAFESSLSKLESLGCDILLTPHPEAATLTRLEAAKANPDAVKEEGACQRFAAQRRQALQTRLASER